MALAQIVRIGLEDGWRAGAREARQQTADWLTAPARVPERKGYEFGVPREGTRAETARAWNESRPQLMEQLYSAYIQCAIAGACIDAVAKGVTSGGIRLRPTEEQAVQTDEPPPESAELSALRRLLRFTNPRENMLQVLRSTITDLYVFGDAFLEVSLLAGQPIALYSLDAPSVTVLADPHGNITGYTQRPDPTQPPAEFEPEEIIHLSLDAPRGGLYGTSPTQKALLPIMRWLWTSAALQEAMRRGNPARVHVDLNKTDETAVERWYQKYVAKVLGARNIGNPITTTHGGVVHELSPNKIAEFLETLRMCRDEIISVYATPPHKVQIIESGNLGGGTGEAQDKTWRVGTVIPVQNLLLEALNYQILQQGFGIFDWELDFEQVDFRDSAVVENIYDTRVRSGAWTLNRLRRELGEPAIEGGDDAVFQARTGIVYWKDMARYTEAEISNLSSGAINAGVPYQLLLPDVGTLGLNAPITKAATPIKSARGPDDEVRALDASFRRAYQARRKRTLRELPAAEGTAQPVA